MKIFVTVLAAALIVGGIFFVLPFDSDDLSSKVARINTTKSDKALLNLNSQINSLNKLIRSEKGNTTRYKKQLLDLLSARMTFTSSFEDLDASKSLVQPESNDSTQIKTNIQFYMMTHQFEKAGSQIERLGEVTRANSELIKSLTASLHFAQGKRLDTAKKTIKHSTNSNPNFSNYLSLGGIEMEKGDFQSAGKNFKKAIEVYANTSPFAPAYAFFNLGVLYGERDHNLELAYQYYKEALHYVPEYVRARVHLSEVLREKGEDQKALQVLLKVQNSSDPEVATAIATTYAALGEKQLSENFRTKAEKMYSRLLKKYPEAFSDHGAEFFLGVGNNPQKALQLAQLNIQVRETTKARELLSRAEQKVKSLKN